MKSDSSEWGPKDPEYTLEKLRKALRDFHEAEGTLPQRLYEAWFQIHLLTPEDFPPSMQPEYREMISAMTNLKDPIAPGANGRVGDARNTIDHMSVGECRRVVGLLSDLIRSVEASVGQPGCAKANEISLRGFGAA